MKRIWIVMVPLLLAGCDNELDRATKRYETAYNAGSLKAQCETAKEAMDAALTLGKEDEYKKWKREAGMQCSVAEVMSQYGPKEP